MWDGYGGHEQAITACICTVPDGVPYDTACVLLPGEHSFIQRPSYVSYRHMRVDAIEHIEKMLSTSVWIGQPPCSDDVLTKIIGGVCHSRLTPREFKRLFGCP